MRKITNYSIGLDCILICIFVYLYMAIRHGENMMLIMQGNNYRRKGNTQLTGWQVLFLPAFSLPVSPKKYSQVEVGPCSRSKLHPYVCGRTTYPGWEEKTLVRLILQTCILVHLIANLRMLGSLTGFLRSMQGIKKCLFSFRKKLSTFQTFIKKGLSRTSTRNSESRKGSINGKHFPRK